MELENKEHELNKLKIENELMSKELIKCKELNSKGEKYWVLIVRFFAFIIGFLPFIPNALFFVGFHKEKTPIGASEVFFIAIGFAMLWGSKNFGSWANDIGKRIIKK